LQRFDLGQETASAQTSLVARRHGDFWQFRAPAAGFLLAGHRGAALCAEFFHQAMMAQLRRGVQFQAEARRLSACSLFENRFKEQALQNQERDSRIDSKQHKHYRKWMHRSAEPYCH
jgi:hypothetical protein